MITDNIDKRMQQYSDFTDSGVFRRYLELTKQLFERVDLREHILGPFADILHPDGDTTADQVRATITTVAVINAVMAGLPGKMGVGVFVSMALEGWMAWMIARHVGVEIRKINDVIKYFGLVGGAIATIIWGFKALLSLAFSLFSVLPTINPMIPAELAVTDLVGILFWLGFEEVRKSGSFTVPKRSFRFLFSETKSLLKYQVTLVKNLFTSENLNLVRTRLSAYLKGESVTAGPRRITDDVFTSIALASLLSGRYENLGGPVGQEFIQSICDLYPNLKDADLDQIAEHMASYDASRMTGVLSNIKGRLFERLAEAAENADGDAWIARLHPDRTHPGTDMELEHVETGELYAVSLKATDRPAYIEDALARYPDDPVWTTDEVAAHFQDDDRVQGTGFSNVELENITRENFEEILRQAEANRIDPSIPLTAGTTVAVIIALWPFVVAYLRKRISSDHLEVACKRLVGNAGIRLAVNLVAAAAFGPVYMWFILARSVARIARTAGIDPGKND